MRPILSQIDWFRDQRIRLEIWPRVRRSGYEHLVLETTLDLMNRGFITTVNHEPDHHVIGARIIDHERNAPAGYIVFEPRPSQKLAHVIIGGTAEEYRRSGLYSLLFKRLAVFLRRQQEDPESSFKFIEKITGCYHVDNESARIMNEKLNRRPVRVTTEYEL